MHYTLHMTDDCNMQCSYCYVRHTSSYMPEHIAFQAIDYAASSGQKEIGIAFFGGEPLLCKALITNTVSYAKKIQQQAGVAFYFKMTTNGILLDQAFIDYAERENIMLALSMDGTPDAHNMHRLGINGEGTYTQVANAAKMLLEKRPHTPVMMTVNPDTLSSYCDSVRHLFALGFVYIISNLNYAADWRDIHMKELERQYNRLADFYYDTTMAEKDVYFSPFDIKISSHIHNRTRGREDCAVGKSHVSIAPDGAVYPCVQFVGNSAFKIGDLDNGIDSAAHQAVFLRDRTEKDACLACAVRKRCNHYCACQNMRSTGSVEGISPALCRHEQILLPVADKLAASLYKKRSPLFIQKHYNNYFPVLSRLEKTFSKSL